jgi:hypothetical protein
LKRLGLHAVVDPSRLLRFFPQLARQPCIEHPGLKVGWQLFLGDAADQGIVGDAGIEIVGADQ